MGNGNQNESLESWCCYNEGTTTTPTQHSTPPLNDNTFKIRWGEDAKDEIFIPAIPKLNYEVQVV